MATTSAPAAMVSLTLDGKKLESQFKVDWARLEMSLDDHHTARIRLVSTAKDERGAERSKRLDDAFDKLSKVAKVEFTPQEGQALLFEGIVSSATHVRELDGDHAVLLTVSSPTILLDAGPRARVWEASSVKDIATSVVSPFNSIKADLGGMPSTQIPYEAQYEETDYQFLRRLAGRETVWLYYDGQKLIAAKKLPESGEAVKLSIQREKGAGRIDELTIKSQIAPAAFAEGQFLSREKEDISADQSKGDGINTNHPFVDLARKGAKDLYAAPVHPPLLGEVTSERELGAYAEARSRAWFRSLVVATAVTSHPGIRPGLKVTIQGANGGEDADYLVTRAVHDYTRHGGYECSLEVVPVAAAYPEVHAAPVATALQRGVVVGHYDPDNSGMVRIRYSRPVENGGEGAELWARVATPHAGEHHGFVALPEIGDEVLVAHAGGRATHPIVVGSVYSTEKKSPVFDEIDGEIKENEGKAFLTKSGNLLLFKDTSGSETIELRSPNGQNVLRLTLDGPKVEIATQGDVRVTADKTVTVKSEGDMTFESKGRLIMKSAQDMTVESQTNMSLKANAAFSAKGNSEASLEGAQLKATGTATAELSGAQASVKGTGMAQVQAPLVKIN